MGAIGHLAFILREPVVDVHPRMNVWRPALVAWDGAAAGKSARAAVPAIRQKESMP